ncbi:NLR family CARD domain-containing protein 4 [Holothuria leucospilota]|uniref:NLR family CARD domain-containing protein 4 n=1 Tax=Holothuria leucospilota TaxID=206669 RepID=A0A9Q1CSQ2_HOLLE|nr:NLR family CARD domain-containing protein 4 [Holothuria leucospilota]
MFSFIGNKDCVSTQYIEINSTGTIQCSFQEGFFGVIWYNSTDLFHDEAVLTMKDSVKSGRGFTSGKLDIYPNGSLIINNVSIADEGNYTVIKLETSQQKDKPYVISVSVIAHPLSNQPEIDFCDNSGGICFQTLDKKSNLLCSLRDARPVIAINWLVRTIEGDRKLSSHLSIASEDGILFTSRASTNNPFLYSPLLTLLVCKGESSATILEDNESLVLVQNRDESLMTSQPRKLLLQNGSVLELYCSNSHISYLVWQLKTTSDIKFKNVLLAVYLEEEITQNYEKEYKSMTTGSLILNDVGIQHEGVYRCISGNGYKNHITLYEVLVFVLASPTHIVVEGCPVQQYCVLNVEPEGTLTCSLNGIRPHVELDLEDVSGSSSTFLTFFNKHLTVKSNGDTFDVSLTLQYRFSGGSGSRVTVECKVTKTDIEQFYLSTKFDLLFLFYFVKIEQVFVRELKEKYRDLYDGVQPIPYIRDRLYCVDSVFVEGGIEYMATREKVGGQAIWRNLETYINILSDEQVKSTRRILEGEPGYGKSTLLLQLAYDWCNKIPSSHLEKTDVLILLRLRQLRGVISVYKAIKQFLLPKDSTLTESDIEDILRKSSSIVILLDGYDEYPDQDTNSDVINIIKRNMFQQVDVIVTTRSAYLPKEYPALTKRLRLTGFDDKARDQYIRKAVVADDTNAEQKINDRLKENPVLKDLCQVPLLFVMFAHMSHENDSFQTFTSVTKFFRYMISCFHSHMKNKMKDENVEKYDLFETDHSKLDQLAFDALNSATPQIVWTKDDMCRMLGNDFYEQYVRIGILREEEVLDITNNTEIGRYKTEVQFYHKLFCEWYAAHYLSEYAAREEVTFNPWAKSAQTEHSVYGIDPLVDCNYETGKGNETDDYFKYLDPFDLQYVYRFACGINSKAAEKIIEYLKSRKDALRFAALCSLERSGKVEDVLHNVQDLCSTTVYIRNDDTFLLQRSNIQLLEIAETNKVR